MNLFKLTTNFTPQGDQPKAIDALYKSIKAGGLYFTDRYLKKIKQDISRKEKVKV